MKDQWLYSELPVDVQAPNPISKAQLGHLTKETAACIYYLILSVTTQS